MFAGFGYQVDAIDIPQSHYLDEAVFPVKVYDGRRIPFADASFDVVFSSNALEHIPHIEAFQAEIRRVLAPGGYAVHLMPSSSWCFWNNLTYYWTIPGKLLSRLRRDLEVDGETPEKGTRSFDFADSSGGGEEQRPGREFARPSIARFGLLRRLIPPRHGEIGNSFTEMYWFSRLRWRRLFEREGFRLRTCRPNRLFYTGHQAWGPSLSIRWRERMSRLLGSSCRIYVVEPVDR